MHYDQETNAATTASASWHSVLIAGANPQGLKQARNIATVGAGSSWPVAVLAKTLLHYQGKICAAGTPQRLERFQNGLDLGILFSTQFAHEDPKRCWRILRDKARFRMLITANASLPLASRAIQSRETVVRPASLQAKGGWIPVAPVLLLARAFLMQLENDYEKLFVEQIIRKHSNDLTFTSPDGIIIVTGNDGEAAAENIATRVHESGAGLCMITDYLNFRHGLFMPAHAKREILILFIASKNDRRILSYYKRAFKGRVRYAVITCHEAGPPAAITLFARSFHFVASLLRKLRVDAAQTQPPKWGGAVYDAKF